MRHFTSALPLHIGTRANRRRWQQDRLWFRQLPLSARLAFMRIGAKREFLPVRPIWRRGRHRPAASVE
jgi:hypothetical protein